MDVNKIVMSGWWKHLTKGVATYQLYHGVRYYIYKKMRNEMKNINYPPNTTNGIKRIIIYHSLDLMVEPILNVC